MNSLICPISKEKVNRSVVRITGFIIAVSVILYAITGMIPIILFLSIDFYIRAFTGAKYSPVSFIAFKLSQLLHLQPIPIDKAPKIFAARVGFIFTLGITILYFINPVASLVVAFTLVTFALLESLFNICVGCIVYTYLVLPFNRSSEQ